MQPFVKDHIGIYKCMAFNHMNEEVSKRIHVNVETKKKTVEDVSNKIAIKILSSVEEFRNDGTIKLKCTLSKINSSHHVRAIVYLIPLIN